MLAREQFITCFERTQGKPNRKDAFDLFMFSDSTSCRALGLVYFVIFATIYFYNTIEQPVNNESFSSKHHQAYKAAAWTGLALSISEWVNSFYHRNVQKRRLQNIIVVVQLHLFLYVLTLYFRLPKTLVSSDGGEYLPFRFVFWYTTIAVTILSMAGLVGCPKSVVANVVFKIYLEISCMWLGMVVEGPIKYCLHLIVLLLGIDGACSFNTLVSKAKSQITTPRSPFLLSLAHRVFVYINSVFALAYFSRILCLISPITEDAIYLYALIIYHISWAIILKFFVLSELDLAPEVTKELYQKELEIRDKEKQAAVQASTNKTQFLRYLFHEVRVPLNSVVLGVDEVQAIVNNLLSSFASSPAVSSACSQILEVIETISESVASMSRLLDDVLNLQKIEEGKLVLEKQQFQLQEVVAQTSRLMSNWLESKQLKLTLQMDPLPLIIGDRLRITQVISNLLSNAIKFTPPGGSINIRVERLAEEEDEEREHVSDNSILSSSNASDASAAFSPPQPKDPSLYLMKQKKEFKLSRDGMMQKLNPSVGESQSSFFSSSNPPYPSSDLPSPSLLPSIKIKVSMTDTGIGISEEDQTRLFKPFVQVEAGAQQKGQLGLSICKRLIELCGGEIGCKSQLGQGSTFFFIVTFPCIYEFAASSPLSSAASLSTTSDSSSPMSTASSAF